MAAPRRKPNSSLKTGDNKENSITFVGNCLYLGFGSALRRKNDAEHYSLIRTFLPGSADMSATIWRDHIVDPVIGNRRPFAVYLDFADRCSRASNGFPAAMIRRSACHRESCGAAAIEFPAE